MAEIAVPESKDCACMAQPWAVEFIPDPYMESIKLVGLIEPRSIGG